MLLSNRRLLGFVFMLVIFASAAKPVTDPDFWWHLKTGQYILDTKTVPHTDIFSTTLFGSEWVTHEWLSELFIYRVFRTLGYGGLIVVFSILITAAFWIVYQLCSKRAGHPYLAGFAVLLGAAATMSTWGLRPQMFSLLFASIFIRFLDSYSRNEKPHYIWWLAPLMILWVNIHAGFAVGLALIVLTIAGLALDALLLGTGLSADLWRRLRPLCGLLIICIVAVSINPSGGRLYFYPFETLTSHAMMQYIEEWKSPDFHQPGFQALGLLILATFSALALSNKRIRPRELLLLVVTCWATLRSSRNVPFFALVAMPLLAEHSWIWITSHRWGQWLTVPEKPESVRKWTPKLVLNVLLLLIALTGVVLWVRQVLVRQPAREAEEFPAAAVDFFLGQRPPQPIYNEYDWGGYLIWKLYPDYRVYIDGRADVYGDRLIKEYLAVHNAKTAWRELLDNRGIQTVLVRPDGPLASLLRLDSGWQKVFEDRQAIVFVRRR